MIMLFDEKKNIKKRRKKEKNLLFQKCKINLKNQKKEKEKRNQTVARHVIIKNIVTSFLSPFKIII